MRLDLLKPVIRANMRTANRRLQQYAKSGVDNPHLNSILEKIKGSSFYDAEKNKLRMGGLSKRDLDTLAEVQKEIKSVDTVKKYTKKVEKIYDDNKELFKDSEMPDINFFARAIETFQSIHGDKYMTWTDWIEQNGNIESKGDTLANMFKDILREQQGVELSQKEIEKLNEDTLEKWEKF